MIQNTAWSFCTPFSEEASSVIPPTYSDLEIRISRDRDPLRHRVELALDNGQEFAGSFIVPPDLKPWDRHGESKDAYGEKLFNLLFSDATLKAGWNRIRGQSGLRRIRLRIDPGLAALHPIQWELLRDPDSRAPQEVSAATATPFSRYLPQDWQPGAAIRKRPIKVLVAVANPSDLTTKWNLQAITAQTEFELLLQATQSVNATDGPAIQFDLLSEPCTLDALRRTLQEGYHVLHFIGHGMYAKVTDAQGVIKFQAFLLLPNPADADRAMRVADNTIAGMLANLLADQPAAEEDKLRLVFLESCGTAKRDSNDAFRGLAPQVIQAGVPAVIAMQDLVEVGTARAFASTFYRQLLRHGQVDLACNEARAAVKAQQLRGSEVPVLFMRVRSGELLRIKGEVATQDAGTFWTRLIERIDLNMCIPFLGPRINAGILPSADTIAARLADDCGYPLGDRQNLSRVAQFESHRDPIAFRSAYLRLLKRSLYLSLGKTPPSDERTLAKTSLTEIVETLHWASQSAGLQDHRIFHLLADLQFPLYITTNIDSLIYQALKHKNLDAHRIGPLWEKNTAGAPLHSVDPEPSETCPYVLHLNGYDDPQAPQQLDHIALSEEEFMSKFVRLYRDQVNILPSNVATLLTKSSYIFLGYVLDDWEFRLVLHGLLQPIAQANPGAKLHVGVQLEVGTSPTAEEVQRYLQEYLGKRFNITVYWGTPRQFVAELHARYNTHRGGRAS
jgi:hypothetical protein